MSANFSIPGLRNARDIPPTPPSGVRKAIYEAEVGPLLDSDKQMLEEYSGLKFDWPPAPGQAYPGDATAIAHMRKMQREGGARLGGGLTFDNQFMPGNVAFSTDFLTWVARRANDSSHFQSHPARAAGGANFSA